MKKITKSFIPGLPETPYEKGINGYIGVCCHSVGCYDSTVEEERTYQTTHRDITFSHFIIDETKILQVADIKYKARSAGRIANNKYVHIELCQSSDKSRFLKAYDNYTWIIANVLARKQLPVVDTKTIVSHKWVSETFKETSSHSDPIEYLDKEHKVSWNELLIDVNRCLSMMYTPIVPKFTTTAAINFILKKIKSLSHESYEYWVKQANSVQYLDRLFTKIATKWNKDDELYSFDVVIKRISVASLPSLEDSLEFINEKIHLIDFDDWNKKARTVPHLELLLKNISYVWRNGYNNH
jgi:N-acetylmuramoyl-L-alanine amidase CwlA